MKKQLATRGNPSILTKYLVEIKSQEEFPKKCSLQDSKLLVDEQYLSIIRAFELWDIAGWILIHHSTPSFVRELEQSILNDQDSARDAGLSMGLSRNSKQPPNYAASEVDRRAA
jgi:hypothetical protein